MKRSLNESDLRKAFRPMPEECRVALMDAARSVKEEQPVKRASFRAVLVAAVLIIASMAVALAATQLGWVDFFQSYHGIAVPQAGEKLLNAAQPHSYQVGPMTFTFKQMLADGRIVLSAAEAHTTDGAEVIYAPDSDIFEAVDALTDVVRSKYKLESGTSWAEAAQQLGLPLYGVRAIIEVDEANIGGESMEEALWNEDGSIVYFNLPATNPATVKESLPVTLYMAVREYDPATGEETNVWKLSEKAEIPVSGMLAERAYQPQADTPLNGLTLTAVRAEQYATGVYVISTFTAPEGMSEEQARGAAYDLSFLDGEGKALPRGISLSGNASLDAWPTVVLENMISVEALPDDLTLTDGTARVLVK
mgnify:CR=1 FL=1